MKRIFFLLIVIIWFISATGCRSAAKPAARTQAGSDSSHVMLHPDGNTVYLDETGKVIDTKQFSTAIKTGQYTFVPKIENGKVKSVQLQKSANAVKVGDAAPDFAVTDIKGDTYSLNQLKGKLVVLNFWFTTCAACIREMPELNDMTDKYSDDKNIIFLAITMDPLATVQKFLAKKTFKYSIVPDQSALIKQYGISGFPTSIIIDRTGGIAFELTSYDDTSVPQLDGVLQALKSQ